VTPITTELARLSGPLAYLLVAALVFGETAIFLGFVIPGRDDLALSQNPGAFGCDASHWARAVCPDTACQAGRLFPPAAWPAIIC
jgi:hypothetical protein